MTLLEAPRPIASAVGYQPHALHGAERDWTEVNCYIDLWIEVLASLGLDPVPMLGCALSADVDGDQWTFIKPAPEDLRALYGIEVHELNVWRPVLEHVVRQLESGRQMTVEVDAFHLPDTRGRAYRLAHEKTTIAPALVDPARRHLTYFHGPGCFELEGEDFDGLFAPALLPPYAETIVLDAVPAANVADLAAVTRELAAAHLRRAPQVNPVHRMAAEIDRRIPWLVTQEQEVFHAFAFGTARQCGGTAELAADLVRWLHQRAGVDTRGADLDFRAVSEAAKSLQFTMARAARGRRADLTGTLSQMADSWESGQVKLRAALLT